MKHIIITRKIPSLICDKHANTFKMFLIFAITLSIFLVFTTGAFADDAYIRGHGDSVVPLMHTNIEMSSELLKIWLNEGDKIDVDVTFVFNNTGNEEIIQMGFPITNGYAPGGRTGEYPQFFKTFIDNKEVKVERKKAVKNKDLPLLDYYPAFYTWDVKFKAGERKTIRNTYSFYSGGYSLSSGERFVDYILKTGALWKGPIGKLDIIVYCGKVNPDFIMLDKLSPADYKISENTIKWHLSDYEPTEDIKISWPNTYLWFFNSLGKANDASSNEADYALYYRGYIYNYILLKPDKAQTYYTKLIDEYPDSTFLGDAYFDMKKYANALEAYQLLSHNNDLGDKIHALRRISEILTDKTPDYPLAINNNNELVELCESNKGTKISDPVNKPDPFCEFAPWFGTHEGSVDYIAMSAMGNNANIYLNKLNDPTKAIEIYQQIQEKYSSMILFGKDDYRFKIAEIYVNNLRDYDKAYQTIEDIIKDRNKDTDYELIGKRLTILGDKYYYDLKDIEKAQKMYERVISINANIVDKSPAYKALTYIFIDKAQWDQADKSMISYIKSLRYLKDQIYYVYQLDYYLNASVEAQQENKYLLDHFENIISAFPDNLEIVEMICNNMINYLSKSKNIDAGRVNGILDLISQGVIDRSHNVPGAYYRLSAELFFKGEKELAFATLTKAEKKLSKNPQGLELLDKLRKDLMEKNSGGRI